eukprot:scaffold89263_cov18-Tisochrysis_lutea.AAC.2
MQGPPNEYPTFLASRPPLFEREAVRLLIELLDKDITPASPGFSVHIAHLSDAGCLPMIKEICISSLQLEHCSSKSCIGTCPRPPVCSPFLLLAISIKMFSRSSIAPFAANC